MPVRIASIINETTADGTGLRTSIYFQGCPIHCPGCHNVEYQTFNGGKLVDVDDVLRRVDDKYIDGITILGGEPFAQPHALYELVVKYKSFHPDKTVWVYTGYYYEYLKTSKHVDIQNVLPLIDVLVDGPFQQGRPRASFRGSDNQRLLTNEDRSKLEADPSRHSFGCCADSLLVTLE